MKKHTRYGKVLAGILAAGLLMSGCSKGAEEAASSTAVSEVPAAESVSAVSVPQETEEEYQLTGDVAYVPDDNWLTGMVPCVSVEYYDE